MKYAEVQVCAEPGSFDNNLTDDIARVQSQSVDVNTVVDKGQLVYDDYAKLQYIDVTLLIKVILILKQCLV